MCGIAGFAGSGDEELLHRMSDVMAHRGPDDVGYWFSQEDQVGLTTRRLSIIDLSPQGHQPMVAGSGQAIISFNGEIYNYRELRQGLESDGFRFRGASDTEVLLGLYVRDGVEMLKQLNGMFAFAIWDVGRRELFVARDGVGVKPVYYAETAKGLFFASEMKSLLQESRISRAIDPLAVQNYLSFMYCPAPRTMLTSVKKLEPGFGMIVKGGRIQKMWRYYDLPVRQHPSPLSVNEAVTGVRTHLARAVQRQLVADVPVGAFLSGGLDSSAVVAIAARHARERTLQCFTIGFRDGGSSREGFTEDLPYARRAAVALGVDLHVVWVGPEMSEQLSKMIFHLDEPQADPAALNVQFICQLARANGIKVLLSGAGGDDIFAGYRRHRALMYERYWSWLPGSARAVLESVARQVPPVNPAVRRLSRAFRDAGRDGDQRIAAYFLWGTEESQRSLYGRWLGDEVDGTSPTDPLIQTLSTLPNGVPPLEKMLYLEGKHFLPDHNLNYTDKMSMACGVEVRVPLLDPDLIAFAATLPPSFKQRGRHGKWIFKKAVEPILPSSIIQRPKTGFGVPVRRWVSNELADLVDEVLDEGSIQERGLFDPAAVRALIDMDRRRAVDASYTILSLLCIELWCRLFVDPPAPIDPSK
jgi:asparagine synthase (glutamine-hydrolysing)